MTWEVGRWFVLAIIALVAAAVFYRRAFQTSNERVFWTAQGLLVSFFVLLVVAFIVHDVEQPSMGCSKYVYAPTNQSFVTCARGQDARNEKAQEIIEQYQVTPTPEPTAIIIH